MSDEPTAEPAVAQKEKPSFFLTRAEQRILKAFRRQYKSRYFIRAVLVLAVLYCGFMGVTSGYYAVQMFLGEHDVEEAQVLPNSQQTIEKHLDMFREVYEHVNFFHIAWANVLHCALLLYVGLRAFLMLRRWKSRTPRAKLVVKMADRLHELGELSDEEYSRMMKESDAT